jgi:hypothetical protein
MIRSIQSEAVIEGLLAVIEQERFVRGPLLRSLADELSAAKQLRASALAWSLVMRLDRGAMSDDEFASGVAQVRDAVQQPATSTRAASRRSSRTRKPRRHGGVPRGDRAVGREPRSSSRRAAGRRSTTA